LNGRLSKIGYGRPLRSDATRNLCYRPALDQDTISSFLNYYAGATLQQPTLFGGHWIPAYSAYTERRGEYKAYLRTTYLGLETSVTRNLGNNIPFRAAYTLEYGKTFAQPAFLCASFSRCDQESQEELQRALRLAVASVSLQSVQTDNLIDPTRGYIVGGEIRGGAPFIGSDPSLQFIKGTTDLSWYRELHSRVVLMLRLRGGLITGGTTVNGVKLPPPQERLYAGGATSVRGFAQNEVGPLTYLLDRDQIERVDLTDSTFAYVAKPGSRASRTIPGGGNSLVVANAELRIRDPFLPELIEYVPFVDGGEVWTRLAGVRSVPETFAVTPGLGIRYSSPIGPIQGNVGYNSNPGRRGPAYFAAPVDLFGRGQAPLLCVTAPGEALVPIKTLSGGGVQQDVSSCPATFTPAQTGLFRHLVFTLSIGTNF
jgi:outer membrane protein insertion porin family/translocation and assembly module TamA